MHVARSAQRRPLRFQHFIHARQADSDHGLVQGLAHQSRQPQPQLPLPAAFLPPSLLALLFMAASSSYPTRSSDRARIAATQISTAFRTSPLEVELSLERDLSTDYP